MAFLFHARAQLTTISGRAWGRLHHLRHVTSLTGIVREGGGGGNLTSVGSLLCDSAASRRPIRPTTHASPLHSSKSRSTPRERNPFRYELLFHFSVSLLFSLIALAFY
jgi:hypothetical protein